MNKIINSDALEALRTLPDSCCRTCITSPPYYRLRDYGADGQIGLEDTPDQYIENLVKIFREVRRVLKDDGTLWVNIGDSYTQKNLNGIPWLLAFALKADGWILRQDIIWNEPNAMPEQTTDRCAKSHEYIFFLSKQRRYCFDAAAIKEPAVGYGPDGTGRRRGNSTSFRGGGAYTHDRVKNNSATVERESHGLTPNESGKRNRRSVWTIATRPYKGAHFATFPEELVRPCILAGSRPGDTVLDPFAGSGITGAVAAQEGRNFIGIEINPDYCEIIRQRLDACCRKGAAT